MKECLIASNVKQGSKFEEFITAEQMHGQHRCLLSFEENVQALISEDVSPEGLKENVVEFQIFQVIFFFPTNLPP